MAFVIISLGICSIISQFILLRELAVSFSGNELSLSIILFLWLLGSGIGGFLARYLIKKPGLKNIIAGLLIFNALWFFIGLFLSRCLKPLLGISPFEIVQPFEMLLISFITVIPQAISIGISFVLLASILKNPVKTYYLETLGAFISGIASLLLIKYFNSVYIVWMISILSLFAVMLIKDKLPILRFLTTMLIVILLLLPFTGLLSDFQYYTNKLRFSSNEQLIASVDSIYANIAVTKNNNQYSVYENGALYFTTEDKEAIEKFAHIIMLNHPNPENILLLGSGVSGILPEILKHPVKSIDYVQPDTKLIPTVLKFVPQAKAYGLDDKKVRVINQDAQSFVSSTKNKYDIVILDQAGPQNLESNRLYTNEFFRQIHRILKSNGRFCFGISSKEDILSNEILKFNACIYKTLGLEFKNISLVPGEKLIFISSSTPMEAGPEKLQQLFLDRGIQTDYFTVNHIKAKYLNQAYIKERLDSAISLVQPNSDYFPAGFFYYLKLRSKQNVFSFLKVWDFFAKINLFYLGLLIFGLSLLMRKNIIKLSIASTGFSGISLLLIISLIFQANFGYLYYVLGAIIAGFMLGACLGAICTNKYSKQKNNPKLLLFFEAGIAITTLLICVFLKKDIFTYFLAVGMAGFLCGAEFAVFCAFYPVSSVYSLDLFGSCIGSLATGLILIPILGIYKTCAAIIIIKIIAIMFLAKSLLFSDCKIYNSR